MSNHLFDAIRASAGTGDAIFIETIDGRRWTYADALRISGQIASAIETLGVRPGDRVAVQVEKSPLALMLYLACVRCGAVYLPLNTAYTLAELDYFIGDAEPRLVVVSSKSRSGVEKIAKPGAIVETLDADGAGSLMELARDETADFIDAARGPDDLAAILYTSGTTGRSKGAMLTHDNLLVERAGLARVLARDIGRPADPCPADLPHAWAVRGDQRDTGFRRLDVPAAEVRSGRSAFADAPLDADDGRTDLLRSPAAA